VQNTNPIILNAYGQADVWCSNLPYKFVLKDNTGVQIWSDDNVQIITPGVLGAYVVSANLLLNNSPAVGAGLVGYGSGNAYSAGTVGYALNNASTGAVAQASQAWTATGTTPNFLLTPSPACPALGAVQYRYRVTWTTAGGVGITCTLNVSGTGAYPLMQFGTDGNLIAYSPDIGEILDVEWNNANSCWLVIDPINPPHGVVGSRVGLQGSTTGSSAIGTWTAAELMLENAAGQAFKAQNLSLTNNITVTGLGGLDSQTGIACSVSISSPAVVTQNAHGYQPMAPVVFSGTAIPTGLSLGTTYFVSPTGLTANTYQLVARCVFNGQVSGTTLTLNTTQSGGFALGMTLLGETLPVGVTVNSLLLGVQGANGSTYTLSATCPTISAETMVGYSASLNTTAGTSTCTVASVMEYNSWYYVFVIYNPTTKAYGTITSSSLTNPNLPSGYTYKARISSLKTQASTNYFPWAMQQVDNTFQWYPTASGNMQAFPRMSMNIGAVAPFSLQPFVPPSAVKISYLISVPNTINCVSQLYLNAASVSKIADLEDAGNYTEMQSGTCVIPASFTMYAYSSLAGYVDTTGYQDNF
jgi:hypothetical protein